MSRIVIDDVFTLLHICVSKNQNNSGPYAVPVGVLVIAIVMRYFDKEI